MYTAEESLTKCEQAIEEYETAAVAFRGHSVEEMLLQHTKSQAKHDAIVRLMGTTNPLTQKPHTATSAEAIVESDAAYAGFLQRQRIVVADKLKAETAMQAAKLRAQIATVAMLTHDVESVSPASLAGVGVEG